MGSGLSVLSTLSGDNNELSNSSGVCSHKFCEKWGPNQYYCCDCRSFVDDEQLMADEDAKIDAIVDESVAEDGINRGVTIQFLLDFANACGCWDMTTREVRRRFVMPATRDSRCRFVELPEMQASGVVGRAVTFVSHTWGAKFGDLVAAVCDGNADRNRRVWVDIFAVRQWSSNKPDLDFSAVVRQCSSFMIVCSYQESIASMDGLDAVGQKIHKLPEDVRCQVAFLRVWCLVEIHAAVLNNITIVMKCGQNSPYDGAVFRSSEDMLFMMMFFINIEASEATVAADKDRILANIRESSTGINDVNEAIVSVIAGSMNSVNQPVIQCAACGDVECLNELLSDPTKYIAAVAGCGYEQLMVKLIDAGANLDDVSILMNASVGGHTSCLKLLVEKGCDINKSDHEGSTPLLHAAMGGHLKCVKFLVECGASVNTMKSDGFSAVMYTAGIGKVECLKYLLSQGADVNCTEKIGKLTALIMACMAGQDKCVQVLLDFGADVNAVGGDKNITALEWATENGHEKCVELLQARISSV